MGVERLRGAFLLGCLVSICSGATLLESKVQLTFDAEYLVLNGEGLHDVTGINFSGGLAMNTIWSIEKRGRRFLQLQLKPGKQWGSAAGASLTATLVTASGTGSAVQVATLAAVDSSIANLRPSEMSISVRGSRLEIYGNALKEWVAETRDTAGDLIEAAHWAPVTLHWSHRLYEGSAVLIDLYLFPSHFLICMKSHSPHHLSLQKVTTTPPPTRQKAA